MRTLVHGAHDSWRPCLVSVTLVSLPSAFIVFFFFFQAEDGIRDWSVTGVQTCALPISTPRISQPKLLCCSLLNELLDVCVTHAPRHLERAVRRNDDQDFPGRAAQQKFFCPSFRQLAILFHSPTSSKVPALYPCHSPLPSSMHDAPLTARECFPHLPSLER